LHPREHQQRAERQEQEVARENDRDRENADRAETAQFRRYFARR
jgi:hypothetical protein